MTSLMVRHSSLLFQAMPTKPLLQQSRPDPLTEYTMRLSSLRKPNKSQYFVKIHERAVQRFESSIIFAMKEWPKSSVTSSDKGVALKPEQTTWMSRIDSVTQNITNKKCACHRPSVLKGLMTQRGTPRVTCW
jgi:hypothetical protein